MDRHKEQINNGTPPPPADPTLTAALAERLAHVRERIAAAAERSGRRPGDVTLVAVSKGCAAAAVRAALAAGHTVFGENRVQEALAKIEAVGPGAHWHLIGHLQTNKVPYAVGRFELVHSVDSVRLIEALEARAARAGVVQPVLLQINVSGEASKYGAAPETLPELLEALAAAPHLRARGLMTIPPLADDPEASRPHFARLRELLASVPSDAPLVDRQLSMGMSGDFEVAIEEGSTIVRIGTAIFGPRGG